jgi:hypothetical protein
MPYYNLLNTNSSVSSDPPPPCYDDDNQNHPCELGPTELYVFLSFVGLSAILIMTP